MANSSHWMQSAVIPSHKGLFGAKAQRAGMSTRAYAKKEAHAPGKLGEEARLAEVFEKLGGHHKAAPKKWTEKSDDAWDKKHNVKEGSPEDRKLDAERGLKSDSFALSLSKLKGGK